MSWYRTYRPQSLSDLHLSSVREQMLRMVKSGTLPHAMLFSGPKGTGKTSSARIIAKVLNCSKQVKGQSLHEPCNECDLCRDITAGRSVNVMEIDAASNRGIDDVRDLKERIYTPPPVGNFLVFIIDEVHMMTKEAFNALLKILEEPPAHAVFILATTEFHKLPDTIVSRCTLVQFHKASGEELTLALETIAHKEKVKAPIEVLAMIAAQADGSFRDAVKLFEEISSGSNKKITLESLQTLLPSLQASSVTTLIDAVLAKDEKKVIEFFQTAASNGVDAQQLHKEILTYLHSQLLKSLGIEEGKSITSTAILQFLLRQFVSVVFDERLPLPLLPLELTALEMILKSKSKQVSTSPGSNSGSNGEVKKTITTIQLKQSSPKIAVQEATVAMPTVQEDEEEEEEIFIHQGVESIVSDTVSSTSVSTVDGKLLQHKWDDLLKSVGAKNLSIEALLRSAKFVRGEQGRVQIQVFYLFHKQQLELDRYRVVVEDAVREVIGGSVKLEYILPTAAPEVLGSAHSNVSGSVSQEVGELISMAEEALL